MNARTVAFCLLGMLGSLALSGTARARPTPIDTDHDAAGALHAGVLVELNAYQFTAALAFPAEALALELLDPLAPTAPGAAAAASALVIPCPGGGASSARWRGLGDAGARFFELRVDYDRCRNETDDLIVEQRGPVSLTVHLSARGKVRVLAVRYGSEPAGAVPARDFARDVLRRGPEGLFLETETRASYVVAGNFMQSIGEVGQLEGDFAYQIRGWRNETGHFVFTDGTPGSSSTGFQADELLVRGAQRRQPGADGVLASDDDTFDIDLRYRSGTLTRQHRGPDGDNDLPFTFDNLALTSSERFITGGKTITLDGIVSVAYPAIAEQRCVSGTFRFTTRQPLLDRPPAGFVSPWIVRGALQINNNVLASFSGESSLESLIDVSLNRGQPVRFGGWPSLESSLPCFVDL